MSNYFNNYAGRDNVEYEIISELLSAGIPHLTLPESLRYRATTEVYTVIIGELYKWSFHRAWRYWICKGPGIEISYAMKLHEQYGQEVRVDGNCGCPSPLEQFKGLAVNSYHVDTFEGLKGLADTIKQIVEDNNGDSR